MVRGFSQQPNSFATSTLYGKEIGACTSPLSLVLTMSVQLSICFTCYYYFIFSHSSSSRCYLSSVSSVACCAPLLSLSHKSLRALAPEEPVNTIKTLLFVLRIKHSERHEFKPRIESIELWPNVERRGTLCAQGRYFETPCRWCWCRQVLG